MISELLDWYRLPFLFCSCTQVGAAGEARFDEQYTEMSPDIGR